MRRIVSRNPREESGAALVEFALVLPLLLLLLFGLLDFGKAFNYWIDETHLANAGARWAAVNTNPGSGTLQAYVLSQADTPELRNGGTSTVPAAAKVCINFLSNSATGTSGQVGDPVEVTVSTEYNWLPFIGSRLTTTHVTLTGSATMRLEAKPTSYGAGCSS
jgi:Flp pilus assembly protein TadG